MLEAVRELLAAQHKGADLEHRLSDVVRVADCAVRRGVPHDAERWTCYALGHARVKARRGADAIAAFWWALTRANAPSDLEAGVSPNLDEQLEHAEELVRAESRPAIAPEPETKPAAVPTIGEVLRPPRSPGETSPPKDDFLERVRRGERAKP